MKSAFLLFVAAVFFHDQSKLFVCGNEIVSEDEFALVPDVTVDAEDIFETYAPITGLSACKSLCLKTEVCLGFLYNSAEKSCQLSKSAETTPDTTDQDTTWYKKIVIIKEVDSVGDECKVQNRRVPYKSDCTKFLECIDEHYILDACPEGNGFTTETQLCSLTDNDCTTAN